MRPFSMVPLSMLLVAAGVIVAACTPEREPDLSTMQTNADTAREGDLGALLHHLYQAEKKAEYAVDAKGQIDSEPGYLFTDSQLRQRALQASEEAVEHRAEAEAALHRILDPLLARIAYLESLHVPEGTGPLEQSILFDTGSAGIPQAEMGKIEEVARFLAAYPVASVAITGYADRVGATGANKELSRRRAVAVVEALRGFGVPPGTAVAVSSMGEGEGPDETPDQNHRSVLIRVEPHGKLAQ